MRPEVDIPVFLNALTALFVIIDPIGTALIFNAITQKHSQQQRVSQALKASLISAGLLIMFGNYGGNFLAYLGISIDALKISGGLLLFYTAFQMITRELRFKMKGSIEDVSVFPMSIPLLAGPGSLTVAILLFSNAKTASSQLAIFTAVLVICSMTFVCMSLSLYVKKIMRKTGDEILRRFLGVVLAALAIQFIMDGLATMLH
jgi:multiple antibiotic resistance protein